MTDHFLLVAICSWYNCMFAKKQWTIIISLLCKRKPCNLLCNISCNDIKFLHDRHVWQDRIRILIKWCWYVLCNTFHVLWWPRWREQNHKNGNSTQFILISVCYLKIPTYESGMLVQARGEILRFFAFFFKRNWILPQPGSHLCKWFPG